MFILCSLLCRFDVFFVCGIGSFLVPRSDFSPSPLYELSPYRRGGCSPDAKQPKEQQEETALRTVFSSCPTGLCFDNQSIRKINRYMLVITNKYTIL